MTFDPSQFGAIPVNKSSFDPSKFGAVAVKQTDTPKPVGNLDDAWKKPQTYTDIAGGIQDVLAGSGAETLKRATAVPTKDNQVKSVGGFLKNLLNPKTYVQAAKDTATFAHGLLQSARTDIGFIPKGVYNLGKDFLTGQFGKEGDQALKNPTLGNDGSTLDKLNAHAESFLTDLTKTAPLYGLADMAESLPDNTNKVPGMKPVNSYLENKYVQSNVKDWSAPVTSNAKGFSSASDIFNEAKAKGNNIGETLTKNKINIDDNIENGKYDTEETAQKIRTDAGKMSGDLLRPSLEKADKFTPKTPVKDITDAALKDIQKSRGITPLDEEAQIAKITAQGEALARKYPEGMSLTDMHDQKINYASNGGYKFGDTPETGNLKATNRAFGRVLGKLVEDKAPPDVPVHEFNAELSKQYQAADYLDSLDKKNVPQTTMQRLTKMAAKGVGAGIGHGVGGGLFGSIAGYQIGGMFESMFENMSNPAKAQFLDNLKKTNPEAFLKVQQFMHDNMMSQINTPQLPAASSIQQPEGGIDVNGGQYKTTIPFRTKP